jgi:UDP-N-acetylglucosamine 4,6-dehydratase
MQLASPQKLVSKKILITGGTGSFGKAFVTRILAHYPEVKRLVVFSRDELKQYEMSKLFPEDKYPGIRFFLGDIRDEKRLLTAMEGIDTVIHAAALKQVPAAEYNPFEFIKTNIIGSENVISAAINAGVNNVVALSTDKASAPVNLYGATKLCADKLFVAANYVAGLKDVKFSVVRYGNVMMSRGSVMPYFMGLKSEDYIPITHPDMTRFNITLDQGVDLVLTAINNSRGGEIYVPKIPSYRIVDVAEAIHPNRKQTIVGIRNGEKIHESMITAAESTHTYELSNLYIIMPSGDTRYNKEEYLRELGATKVSPGFEYSSNSNGQYLTQSQIKDLIDEELNKQ